MTATVDLLVLKKVLDADDVYEPEWLLAHYVDTAGLWKEGKDRELEFQANGKGIIIDALFGDGPKRYGFNTTRPVVLVDYNYRRQETFSFVTRKNTKDHHVVIHTSLTECLQRVYGEGRNPSFRALSLLEFVTFLQTIPLTDMENCRDSTVPMNAFLVALKSEGRLLLPVIGMGLAYEFETVRAMCGFGSGIVNAPHIE